MIVDPFRSRLAVEIVAEGALRPNEPITLRIEGRAAENISGGEVTVTLPTQAGMAAGGGGSIYYPTDAKLPVVARWTLPSMVAGSTWQERITVGPVESAYYHVAVQTSTRGARVSPYIIDDGYRKAWMFVVASGGVLTDGFDGTIFQSRHAPVPGPFRPKPPYRSASAHAMQAAASRTAAGSSSVRLHVVYNERGLWQRNAVGAQVWANTVSEEDPDYIVGSTQTRTVPTSGIVQFTRPPDGCYLAGGGNLPSTNEVGSGSFLGYREATDADCGETKQVTGTDHTYMPWANLKEVIPLVDDGFGGGYKKATQAWRTDLGSNLSHYLDGSDEIVFGHASYWFKFTAAHEYGHAVHARKLGGLWGTEPACANHDIWVESGYRCAFQEGLADYAGKIGSRVGGSHYDFENPDDDADGAKAQTEGYVAALFRDLIDSANEGGDKTTYSAHYVMTVLRTCEVRFGGQLVGRDDVSDFVRCLENQVEEAVHEANFPGIATAGDAYESAHKPWHWDAEHIRSTWLQNVGVGE